VIDCACASPGTRGARLSEYDRNWRLKDTDQSARQGRDCVKRSFDKPFVLQRRFQQIV
jgi:hypothetical protein